jgi:hypothetical protein
MIKRNYTFITLVITIVIIIIILFLSSCATPNPMLTPPTITNKLLTIKVFFKNTIKSNFSYTYNGQNLNYYFYCALCFRFDNTFNNLNIDRWEHIYFFENGFKRFKRINDPSHDTSTSQEWSNIIPDTNSNISNNILNFNILIPDDIIGSPTIYNFIVIVFLRDKNFEYNQMSDDFGQSPIDYYGTAAIQNITIDISNTSINQTYVLQDNVLQDNAQENDLVQSNLPPGFPDNYKESLDITKIEYIIRQ